MNASYKHYPTPVKFRSGCKVSWKYYTTREEAEEAAKAARHNAEIQWSLGYDFGYCSPGSITEVKAECEYKGLYEVCIP